MRMGPPTVHSGHVTRGERAEVGQDGAQLLDAAIPAERQRLEARLR